MASAPRAQKNGNGSLSSAEAAALRVRVDNLADDVHGIRSEVRDLASALSLQMRGLEQKQDSAQKPNWQMWGVAITGLIALGALAYWPISRDTSRLDGAVGAILDRGVFQRQYDADQTRAAEERKQLRTQYESTILGRRYETDQARLTDALNGLEKSIELLRLRSFEAHGQTSALETKVKDQEGRLDAISRRLAEFIRDMGKH